jgi:uncharacterized protein
MLVVSDTSPISNCALIGRLNLLQAQFHQVWIPPAVRRELDELPDAQGKAVIQEAFEKGWLRTAPVGAPELVQVLSATLHAGESEAIALSVELHASLVLIDEREARAAAALLNLRVTGVLGVLLRAKREGGIDSLRHEVSVLRAKAGFFVAPRLEEQLLAEAGE